MRTGSSKRTRDFNRGIPGKRATEVYQTEAAPYLEEYAAVAISKQGTRLEVYFPPLKKYFTISIVPWGKLGFATIFSDITERKTTEKALIEGEERYHALFQNNPAVMLLIAPRRWGNRRSQSGSLPVLWMDAGGIMPEEGAGS